MAVIDSYSEINQDDFWTVNGFSNTGASQSFTGDGNTLNSAKFYLQKSGSPTGNLTYKVYAHSGTFGTSSVPTGSALATSNTLDVSTLITNYALYELIFSSPVTLINGTNYVLTVEYSGGDNSNFLKIGRDSSSPTHGGNAAFNFGGWSASSNIDTCFYALTAAAATTTSTTTTSTSSSTTTTSTSTSTTTTSTSTSTSSTTTSTSSSTTTTSTSTTTSTTTTSTSSSTTTTSTSTTTSTTTTSTSSSTTTTSTSSSSSTTTTSTSSSSSTTTSTTQSTTTSTSTTTTSTSTSSSTSTTLTMPYDFEVDRPNLQM